MGLIRKRRLVLEITNESETDFVVSVIEADGELQNEDDIKSTLKSGESMTIKARRSSSYGPKLNVYLHQNGDDKAGIMIYSELSINDDNPRCCYVIPYGDCVCAEQKNYYWYEEKDHVFNARIKLGKIYRANTFYHISDTHIGYDLDWSPASNEYHWQRYLLREINKDCLADDAKKRLLKCNGLDESNFSSIDVPNVLGIIHTGDIFCSFDSKRTEDDFDPYFRVYKKIYTRADKRSDEITEPYQQMFTHLFEGAGNHDDCCAGNHKVEVWHDIERRNKRNWRNDDHTVDSRMSTITYGGNCNYHYTWKWKDVIFVQLNFAVSGNEKEKVSTYNEKEEESTYVTWAHESLDYLLKVLEDNKDKKLPVIICCHVGIANDTFYSKESSQEFIKVLESHPEIIAVIHGHTHHVKLDEYSLSTGRKVPCIDAGRAVSEKLFNCKRKYTYLKYIFDTVNTADKKELELANGKPNKIEVYLNTFCSDIDGKISPNSTGLADALKPSKIIYYKNNYN